MIAETLDYVSLILLLRDLNEHLLEKWTKFRENGQNTRRSRKLIHAKFNPLKVSLYFLFPI